MELKTVKTPCVGICSTGIGDEVCRGCKRFSHEVIHWNGYDYEQKALIESRLVGLLTQIIRNKFEIVDEGLMRWQIDQQPIEVPLHRDLYCQAYTLIKAGASQISDPAEFGFRVLPASTHKDLKTLCFDIDTEYYALSVAHYQRCFVDFGSRSA
ncbi:Uncharacterised protein [BD1-7 clade bacterium]|uniref:DUF1289 domain-containing protein n=1 Tax=BD1-7 clade bacterium TaxID=2029982 RepID=A0A5S9QK72_9GAMM|nr:Uncharacterised protein [BD1-7 clade bacterium]